MLEVIKTTVLAFAVKNREDFVTLVKRTARGIMRLFKTTAGPGFRKDDRVIILRLAGVTPEFLGVVGIVNGSVATTAKLTSISVAVKGRFVAVDPTHLVRIIA